MRLVGIIGVISVLIKKEILLVFVGGIFVIEVISVILQIASNKFNNGNRIFKKAPIHHHFELCGLHENKVIIRFWIIAIIVALLSLATLKLR